MPKSKKTNPNKVPLAHPFDYAAFMETVIQEENIHSCLLVMSALAELDSMTPAGMMDTWKCSNRYDAEATSGGDLKVLGEQLFGFRLPFPNAVPKDFRTEGEVKRFKQQVRRNCVYSGICVFCVAAFHAGVLDKRTVQATYLNAQITEEEIIRGRSTYDEIRDNIRKKFGIEVAHMGGKVYVNYCCLDSDNAVPTSEAASNSDSPT